LRQSSRNSQLTYLRKNEAFKIFYLENASCRQVRLARRAWCPKFNNEDIEEIADSFLLDCGCGLIVCFEVPELVI